MDRTTKHRILGIVVVIGLVIIMLPLFQSSKEAPTEVTVVKAPPFPDQSVQVTANDSPDVQNNVAPVTPIASTSTDAKATPDDKNKEVVTPVASIAKINTPPLSPSELTDSTAVKTDLPTPVASAKKEKTPTITEKEPDVLASNEAKEDSAVEKVKTADQVLAEGDEPTSEPLPVTSPSIKKTAKAIKQAQAGKYNIVEEHLLNGALKTKKTAHQTKQIKHDNANVTTIAAARKAKVLMPMHASLIQAPLDNNGLISLKSAAWVIQMGSFKNKTNALRLVNQLRASGYRAFIQRTSTALGESTRVFVGPENKQANARALASRLETDMHLRGIVISYKPLVL